MEDGDLGYDLTDMLTQDDIVITGHLRGCIESTEQPLENNKLMLCKL